MKYLDGYYLYFLPIEPAKNVIKNRMRHTVELLHNQAIIIEERIPKRELEEIWTDELLRETAYVQ